MSPSLHLVAGLGNPGPAYTPTRHNVGFWALDDLAGRLGARFSIARGQRAEVTTGMLPGDHRLVLVKPTTFMNDSGVAVAAVARFHRIPPADVIVVHDELDLDPTRLRLKFGGGDNGHNGLKSIRAHLGTGDFHRVRVGIGRPPGRQPAADYVLSRMRPADLDAMRLDAAVAADAVEALVAEGLAAAQNRFNS
ncbi:aminoacyl-tRNA hydrolase [Arachnia rubra]|uniref:Peptidyl-tRNA hydrolase n=1 Tax=Arachnia rubra TaxID=1547448 RepID=A0ABX7Y476_9ACTN|nr:aminoacyl-tRNA hydrolase [Arachnia rubra]MBB1571503.1 aminoacyl-tRNA hydrolase [Propionibacterium sp.]MDO4645330.1 aminoacyl-tRNA hydrolase [Propionibacteriaceae bacterium]MBB1576335.1 aminoacyl-tRNA hydrolase [Propionibacterium sp.]QUC07635.1 aminoacyl-tRNA hydrolase [Arachnia rubra]BCR81940.1 peptidyl-tRNA hydrolase [Arachnia rubra]